MTFRAISALVTFLTTATSAPASESGDCREMAKSFNGHFFGFPEIVSGTEEEFASWRASCATEPPGGLGNVFALCQAELPDGGHVFYWRKTAIDAETSGYEICDYP